MACNAVATTRARVAVDLSQLMDPTPAVAELVKRVVAAALDTTPAHISPIDYRSYRPGSHPSAGAYEYYAYGSGISVDVFAHEIQVGARSVAQASELKAKLAPALQGLAALLTQAKIRAAVAARVRITAETRTPTGALVLNVEL